MSDEWWGLAPAVSGALRDRGWQQDDDILRQVLPAVARHGNAVIAVPPTPSRAAPVLAGMVAAVTASRGRALVLAAPALVGAVGREIARLAAGTELRIVTATGPARASRRLADGSVDVLVASPATALALHTRSALRIDAFTSLVLAWPEDWDAGEAVTVLLADLPKEAQRLVLTGDPRGVVELVERHARRSLTVGFPDAEAGAGATQAPGTIRSYHVSWTGRSAGLTGLLELLDPASLAVWTADRGDHPELEAALSELPTGALAVAEVPDSALIVCHDLPTPGELAALAAGREVVLMVPPGTEGYVNRIAPSHRPIREAGAIDLARDRDATLRAEIVAQIEHRDLSAAGYAIAPLLDRYDPQAVAAACFALWRRGTPAATAAPGVAEAPEPATPVGGVARAKVWVGVGRRDDATPGDLVAVLIKEVGLAREAVGRIELRETFSLVEVPTEQADRVAQALTGLTIRRRKLVARVDRGIPSRGPGMARSGGGRPPRRGGPGG